MEVQQDFKELLRLFNANDGCDEFIENKRAIGRMKDRADLEALGEK